MQTLGMMEQSLSWTFYLLTGILLIMSLVRVNSIFLAYSDRYTFGALSQKKWLKSLKVVYGLSWLLFLFGLPNALFITSSFRRILPEHITLMLLAVFLLLGLIELVGCFTISPSLIQNKLRQAVLVLAVLLLGFNATKQLKVGTQIYRYPSFEKSYLLQLPVKGTWTASQAGGSLLTNEHLKDTSQRYGMDLYMVTDEGQFFSGDGSALTDHQAFKASVYAPASGKVISVVDHLPNATTSIAPSENENPLGNYVILELDSNRFLFLAHLDNNSVAVNNGDYVAVGNLIGKVGNSGKSNWPHLHMHIQDSPSTDDEKASSIAIRFEAFERKRWFEWVQVKNGFLLRNDVFRRISD